MQKLLLIRKKAISRSCISKSDEWEYLGRGDTKKLKGSKHGKLRGRITHVVGAVKCLINFTR